MSPILDAVEINEGNREPRQALVLLLDTSGSMAGANIAEANAGIKALQSAIRADGVARKRVEVCIVTFGGQVCVAQEFVEAARFEPPELHADGDTPLGEAIEKALRLVEDRKGVYRTAGLDYFRPWIFLVTDGAPTDGEQWKTAAASVHAAEAAKRVAFFSVGTSGADFDVLGMIASAERPPLRLMDGKWAEMFRWLSSSMKTASKRATPGEQAPMELPNAWGRTP